jgi:diguanylate cyclase (GGDEF)-like protein
VSLLLLDLDLFKRVNDTRGHRAGDLVLSALARFLTRALRAEDVAARYGGEEFAILLRDIPHDQALRLADRIRRSVEVLAIPWEGTTLRVTVSVGVGTLAPRTGEGSVEHLIEIADRALYRAKQGGRNQVSD